MPLDNVTLIGRDIMKTLSVIRDAKEEVRDSIKEMEQNECIQQVDPWNFDYSKLETLRSADVRNIEEEDTKQDIAHNVTSNDPVNGDGDDFADEFDDLLFLGMNDEELSALQSLRAYQILECIGFVDEVIHHIYLFIIKHFRENRFDLEAQKKWLTHLAESVALLPNHVDELSCCLYPPHPPDDAVCRIASNLLHFVWSVSIEIAEESTQYKHRKMVIKNKKSKSKVSLTGHQWKCKFVSLSVVFGEWFGLGTMGHIQEFMEKDTKYAKEREEKRERKKERKHHKKDKMRRLKKKRTRKSKKEKGSHGGSTGHDVSASASSLKETETSQTASVTSNVINDEEADSDDMVNID